jgi:hypothetical protein
MASDFYGKHPVVACKQAIETLDSAGGLQRWGGATPIPAGDETTWLGGGLHCRRSYHRGKCPRKTWRRARHGHPSGHGLRRHDDADTGMTPQRAETSRALEPCLCKIQTTLIRHRPPPRLHVRPGGLELHSVFQKRRDSTSAYG